MKKLGLLSIGFVAAIVALSNLDSMIELAIAAFIAYVGLYFYRKSESSLGKMFWGIVMVFSILSVLSNLTAVIGFAALIGVLYIWKKWKEDEADDNIIEHKPSDDPFVNFERQWSEMKHNR